MFNIMLSCAGRRVALLRILEQTLRDLHLEGFVLATDAQELAPAFQCAQKKASVPRCLAPNFVDEVLRICIENEIRCIIPTIDTELPILAAARSKFEEHGICCMVSSPECIAISNDKRKTHAWFVQNGFPTFQQTTAEALLENPVGWAFPLFMKPYDGSRSLGARRVESLEEVKRYASPSTIVQSLGHGVEVTADAFITRGGKCRCVVPRQRLEVRDGEVSKGKTIKVGKIVELVRQVSEALPGAYGTICVQLFYDFDTENCTLMEINPRFGGGYPLSHAAGAPFTRYLIEDILQADLRDSSLSPCEPFEMGWEDQMVMLRYDDAVFLKPFTE